MSPLSNLPSWSHFSKPHHGGMKPFFFGVLVGLLLALLPWEGMLLGLTRLVDQARSRSQERNALGPMMEKARNQNLSYEQISAAPKAFVGRPVLWCVDHPDVGISYHAGRPAQPVSWTNKVAFEAHVPLNAPTTGGRCTKVLATVQGKREQGEVVLWFVGVP